MRNTIWSGATRCDICGAEIENTLYDARLPHVGTWATMCADCFDDNDCELGTGKGQMCRKNEIGEFEKVPYTAFAKWLDTFIKEKGIERHRIIEVQGREFYNMIEVGVVVDTMKQAAPEIQQQIKNTLVKIDFFNGDVIHFLTHCAKALAY